MGMGFSMDCSAANEDANDNFCAEHLCSCEMSFFATVLDLLWAGAERTEAFDRNADFDADEDPAWCGEYPDRKLLMNGYECCYASGVAAGEAGGARRIVATQDCCPDGSVKDTGTCA